MHRSQRFPQWCGALIVATTLATSPISAQRLLGPKDVDTITAKAPDATLAYGSSPEQFGELRVPRGAGRFPIAIVLHGGCFRASMGSVRSSAALSDALRDAGVATWNVEYRRTDNPGGGWPGTFLDVATAADYVRTLAAKYPVDTTRVIVIGHSAGGFLATWLAARTRLSQTSPLYAAHPIRLRAVVALGSDGDLPPIEATLNKLCGPTTEKLFGGSLTTGPDRLTQANPATMLPFGVQQILIAGTADPFETPALRDGYAMKVKAAGDAVDVVAIAGAGHFEVVAPTSAAWPVVRERILRSLRETP